MHIIAAAHAQFLEVNGKVIYLGSKVHLKANQTDPEDQEWLMQPPCSLALRVNNLLSKNRAQSCLLSSCCNANQRKLKLKMEGGWRPSRRVPGLKL